MVYSNTTGTRLNIYIPVKYRLGSWCSDGQCVRGYYFMAVDELDNP